jgi:calcineurin-like phosphoesterase family protein
MSTVRFIGCLHFQHRWMANHRGFTDEWYHDEHLIESWNRVVGKRDLTFILGDVSMESAEPYYLLDRLQGRKICVLGNHDRHQDVKELLKYVETVAGVVDYKGYVLSHVPIHPSEISFCRGNIHAHIHENILEECIVDDRYGDTKTKSPTLAKYFNVDAQRLNYTPMSMGEITAALGQENWTKPQKTTQTWEK